MPERNATDVLICGAGAAGLTLAIDLARRGVSFRLIDKLEAAFAGSRGKAIQPRTQEVFEDLGIVDRIAAGASPYPVHRIYKSDGTFEERQEIVIAPPTAQEPFRTPLMIPQMRTEAAMRERLAELGEAPRYKCELVSFEQDAEGVLAQLFGPKGIEHVRCRYLVGGDGGRSFVRRALQLEFPGKTLGVRAIVADIVLGGLERDAWHRFNEGEATRQLSFCPLPYSNQFQLQAPVPPENEVDLSAEGLQAFVDDRLPGSHIKVQTVLWSSVYSMNARLADRYRVGRVLLIGDAAHIHPPTGGQGLNTSVQDAYNLGWKLHAVLAGAPDALLETYEEERRPIAAAMLGIATDLLTKAQQGSMKRGRDTHQLDLNYRFSSLSLARSPSETGIVAGDRMPDARLRGAAGQSRRLFDFFKGPHWSLVIGGEVGAIPAARKGLQIIEIGPNGMANDEDGAFATIFGLALDDTLLIRPDGYVAARVKLTDMDRLDEYLSAILPQ